jgi:hypothetical protein
VQEVATDYASTSTSSGQVDQWKWTSEPLIEYIASHIYIIIILRSYNNDDDHINCWTYKYFELQNAM